MNIHIKRFSENHYDQVVSLFKEVKWAVPTFNEIRNIGWVAIDGLEVVGFIWCLVGKCSTAYIDHLVVKDGYRGDKKGNRSIVGLMLAHAVFNFLSEELRMEKWICATMPGEPGDSLGKFYDSLGFNSTQMEKRYIGSVDAFKKKLNELTRG